MRLLVAAAVAAAIVAALAGAAKPGHQTFPGRNGLLAYSSTNHFCDRPCGRRHIYTIKTNGSHKRRLTGLRDATQPAWSPDGRQIAFATYAVLLMDADGSNVRKVAKGYEPTFSPNGKRIAYRGGKSGFALMVVKTDGKGARRVANNALEPDWSPDGRKIAFARKSDVYVVSAKGGRAKRLTHLGASGGSASEPSWSPSGRKIAVLYRGPDDVTYSIAVMKSSGRGLHVVGPRASQEGKAAWSPTGKRIAYVKGNEGAGRGKLVTINANGTRPRTVTKVGYSGGVSWQAR